MRSLLSGSVFVVAVIACAACLFGCEDELPVDPPPDKTIPGNLRLEVDYSSTHEIGFRCGSQDTVRPLELRIQYGPQRWWRQFTLQGEDTLFVLSGLQPGTEYLVNLIRIDEKGAVIDSTTPMMVSTLEIGVSHDITWEEVEIGGSSSWCYDVWVLHDSCIYVVGHDLGSFTNSGQMAYYDGKEWQILKIISVDLPVLYAVYGFSESDIWVGGRNDILHYTGKSWTRIPADIPGKIEAIWGRRPDDVWFGGEAGTLLHWNGHSMERWHLSTEYNIRELDGGYTGKVYALVEDNQPTPELSIWGFDRNEWSRLMYIVSSGNAYDRYHLDRFIYGGKGFWCDETGGLLNGRRYVYRYSSGRWYMPQYIEGNALGSVMPMGSVTHIAGWSPSDYFLVNYDNDIYHVNGVDTKKVYAPEMSYRLKTAAADAGGTSVCVVGTRTSPEHQTVVFMGRR